MTFVFNKKKKKCHSLELRSWECAQVVVVEEGEGLVKDTASQGLGVRMKG